MPAAASRPPTARRTGGRYDEPRWTRKALAPGLLAVVALAAGLFFLEVDGFTVIRFLVAILALIVAWFAIQAKHWWWVPVMLAIAVIWNPIVPFAFAGPLWITAQFAAGVAFLIAGLLIREPWSEGERA